MNNAQTSDITDLFGRGAELLVEGISHLLWPRVCCNCDAPILKSDDGLCSDCWRQMRSCTSEDYCRRCGSDAGLYSNLSGMCSACKNRTFQYDGIARAGVYKDVLRDMILNLKFSDRPELSLYLGRLADAALIGSGFADKTDFYVPVPLHWRRRIRRGFNQSMLLCRQLTCAVGKINTDFVRIKYTHRQWNLTSAGRRKNVAGAFAVRKGHCFQGKTICLVDDLTTSGATLNECAKTLKRAGAEKVYALVAAVAL